MLRTNLSTRPFYNERLVHLVLALVAVIVGAITVLNVVTLIRLSRQNTTLSAAIRDDRSAADDYTKRARDTRQGLDKDRLTVLAAAAREANTLIDGRTFSWTGFLNHIEATLPPDVMLASIRPSVDAGGTRITLGVVARRSIDIDEFIEKLEATGAFDRGLQKQVSQADEGQVQGTVEILYVPTTEAAAEAEPPAPAAPKPPAGGKGASR
jgi:Tfp pilus assembly protein PilN